MMIATTPTRLLWAGLLVLAGCDAPTATTRADIPGARFLAFRCVADADDGLTGLPLDGCGCSEKVVEADGTERLRAMGSIECDCVTLDGFGVRRVEETCAGGTCAPAISAETGDWIPVEAGGQVCRPRRNGRIHGYVGSPEKGEVAVIDVAPPGDADESGRILDVSRAIPGVTAVYVDDLVSDIEADPDGRLIFTVNSSSGTLSVIRSETSVREDFKLDLASGPLLEAAVWPAVGRARPTLGGPAVAFVTQPQGGAVLELDLDAVAAGAADVIRDRHLLPTEGERLTPPGRVAVTDDGALLLVGHATEPRVTVFDRTGGPARTLDLAPRRPCGDGYAVRVVEPEDDTTCADGIDNNGDGRVDADDPACTGSVRSEAVDPSCPKQSECADGADNDGDGLVDADDPDCDPAGCADGCPSLATWLDVEGPIPACADGVDNDGDGRVDRADPGCSDEADGDEADAIERADRDGVCDDGLDNDGDGLIDAEDPGCTDPDAALRYRFEAVPACADGEDNDADGHTDFGDDPDCFAASDDLEGKSAQVVGPTAIETLTVPGPDGLRRFAYVVDPSGNLLWIDLDDPALPIRRIGLGRVTPLALAARVVGTAASLLMVGSDTALRSIEVSAPTPLRTEDGRPVHARLDPPLSRDKKRVVSVFSRSRPAWRGAWTASTTSRASTRATICCTRRGSIPWCPCGSPTTSQIAPRWICWTTSTPPSTEAARSQVYAAARFAA
ncbi:MAG: hypothetical protein R3F43_29500 [bacterium]